VKNACFNLVGNRILCYVSGFVLYHITQLAIYFDIRNCILWLPAVYISEACIVYYQFSDVLLNVTSLFIKRSNSVTITVENYCTLCLLANIEI
jgi:hypothetical protein